MFRGDTDLTMNGIESRLTRAQTQVVYLFLIFYFLKFYKIYDIRQSNIVLSVKGFESFPTCRFNGSVNNSESCDFRSQFDPLNIMC